MTTGLPVANLINVSVIVSPLAANFINFNSVLIVGNSNVINVKDRIRTYSNLSGVAADFGTTAPEYLAADLFFSQIPTPTQLYIGRWAQTATSGLLIGGVLTSAQQAISNWTSITSGSFKVQIDGSTATNIGSLNFSTATSLSNVAATIQTALQAIGTGGFTAATCTWNGSQFVITSGTTGTSSSVSALTAGTSNDISAQLLGTASTLSEIVAGIAAESAVQCVEVLDTVATQWYGLMFASTSIVDSDHLAIAAYIQGDASVNPHIYGVTTGEAAALTTSDSTSIGYQLKQFAYSRTFCVYSSTSPYAAASLLGLGAGINFAAQNSTINWMYKQCPGIVAEYLTPTQAAALNSNYYSYFAHFNNNTSILVNGYVSSGSFIDQTWNLDWLQNQIQTNVYNLFYTSPTKIPQTDAGMQQIVNAIVAGCQAGVNNGTIAPGTWTGGAFGQLQTNQFLSTGYYVYAPPVSTQSASARAARQSVPFQVAVKLAGAVNSVNISVLVNV